MTQFRRRHSALQVQHGQFSVSRKTYTGLNYILFRMLANKYETFRDLPEYNNDKKNFIDT